MITKGSAKMKNPIRNGGVVMETAAEKLAEEIKSLTDVEKLRLVDVILTDLDKPDPELDGIWAEEALQTMGRI